MDFPDLFGRPDIDIHRDLARRKKVRDRDIAVYFFTACLIACPKRVEQRNETRIYALVNSPIEDL